MQTLLHCCSLLWLRQAHIGDAAEKPYMTLSADTVRWDYGVAIFRKCSADTLHSAPGLSGAVRDSLVGPEPNPDCSVQYFTSA